MAATTRPRIQGLVPTARPRRTRWCSASTGSLSSISSRSSTSFVRFRSKPIGASANGSPLRRSNMSKRIFLAAAFLLLLPCAMSSTTDPFLGKWKLDLRRSKYPANTCPKSMVIEMRSADQGVWYHSDATYKNGGEIHAQYTAGYDGKQVIVMGDRGLLLHQRIESQSNLAISFCMSHSELRPGRCG